MQPQTLPPDFYSFMLKAARVPKELLELNNLNVRNMPLDTLKVMDAVQKYRPTAKALKVAQNLPAYPPVVPWYVPIPFRILSDRTLGFNR
jgi:hypothetical protein